jgi:hypothetical protein
MSLSFITKPNKKVSKKCPMCSGNMIENHFKDLVCHCTGKCLDLPSLETLYSQKTPLANRIAGINKFNELHEPIIVKVVSGFDTVLKANQLKAKGFSWDAHHNSFFKKYSAKQDSYLDTEFLRDFGYRYTTQIEQD